MTVNRLPAQLRSPSTSSAAAARRQATQLLERAARQRHGAGDRRGGARACGHRRCGHARHARGARARNRPARVRRHASTSTCCISRTGKRCPTTCFRHIRTSSRSASPTLYRLPTTRRGVLVVPVATLMQRLAPRSFIGGSSLVLDAEADARPRQPSSAGSKPPVTATCRRCSEPGDFAVRGALLDIFPMGSAEPYRIELFDREIESIRTFDPETQRSAHKVEKVQPAAGARVSADRRRDQGIPQHAARTLPDRSAPLPALSGHQGRHDAGRHRVLPAAVLRSHRDAVRLSRRHMRCSCSANGALDAAEHFWQQAQTRYEQPRARHRTADPAGRRSCTCRRECAARTGSTERLRVRDSSRRDTNRRTCASISARSRRRACRSIATRRSARRRN